MKKIVIFSDGTGNSSSNPHKTNVWRAYQALDRSPAKGQVALYDNGVGSSSFMLTAVFGLAFGFGLARNVRQLYGFVCRTYKPGDEIFGFGFSRGAFTMRVVVALIATQGIINPEIARDDRDLERLIKAAYRRFRQEAFTPSLLSFFLRPLRDWILNAWHSFRGRGLYDPKMNYGYRAPKPRDTFLSRFWRPMIPVGDAILNGLRAAGALFRSEGSEGRKSRAEREAELAAADKIIGDYLVKFIGVWDTVDAYGLPVDELTRAWDKVIWPLTAKDRDLSGRVEWARHALALDEQRKSFEPMLWNEGGLLPKKSTDGERVTQIWFPGMHADVGGGYPDDALATVSFNWMLDEAEKVNLVFSKSEREKYRNKGGELGPLHDSRRGLGNVYRYDPRDLEYLCHEKKPGLWNWLKSWFTDKNLDQNEVHIELPKFHHSIFDRMDHGGDSYAPFNIPAKYVVVGPKGKISELKTGKSPAPCRETSNLAERRTKEQRRVWAKAGYRKFLYYVTLVVVLAFALYPYARGWFGKVSEGELASFAEKTLGVLTGPIRAIPGLIGKIPGFGFAEGWAVEYGKYPYAFTLFLVSIAALLIISQKFKAALEDNSRRIWAGEKVNGDLPARGYGLSRHLSVGTETIAVVFFLLLVVLVVSRTVFVTSDGIGFVCEDDPTARGISGRTTFIFDPKDPCFNSGLRLRNGREYLVEIAISDDWSDAGVYADVNGWQNKALQMRPDTNDAVSTGFIGKQTAPASLYIATPLLRDLASDWYQPIARIGNNLFDRYPLKAVDEDGTFGTGRKMILRQKIKARRTGPLYLYLNDAVPLTATFPHDFYKNNCGCAWVSVTPLFGEGDPYSDPKEEVKIPEKRMCPDSIRDLEVEACRRKSDTD